MTSVYITTTDTKAKILTYIAGLIGATVKLETPRKQSLQEAIQKGKDDLANGRKKTFTVEELENLFDERP